MAHRWTTVVIVAMATVLTSWSQLPFRWEDSLQYIRMAEGHFSQVPEYHASRFLLPVLVMGLKSITALNIDLLFYGVGFAALVTWLASLAKLLAGVDAAPFLVLLTFSPLLLNSFQRAYYPQLLQCAFVGAALVFLKQRRDYATSVCVFLSVMTSESTIVLCGVLLVLSARQRRLQLAVGVAIATVVGLTATTLAAHLGQPNNERLPTLVFLLLRVPFWLSHNLGVALWDNTHSNVSCALVGSWHVPGFAHLGRIGVVGVCRPSVEEPMRASLHLLASFGVLPSLLIAALIRRGVPAQSNNLWVHAAISYGLIVLFTAPLLTDDIERIAEPAWVAFWAALPVLLGPILKQRTETWIILGCQSVAAWSALGLRSPLWLVFPLIVIAVCAHVIALKVVWSQLPRRGAGAID